MKLTEIRSYKFIGKKALESTVMKGIHFPEVEIYHDMANNKSYQVSEEHGLYRETPGTADQYEVQNYGEWKRL